MRGKGNEWTYPGEDALGKMLVKLREEIRITLKESKE
jgi:hypothetical protein